ncbi:MAG: glycosyltransferase family 39 protein [Saprospiraceae bacterium]|nr:glycosyltransferase family 39 protein [Saprospiraceae bacterium]
MAAKSVRNSGTKGSPRPKTKPSGPAFVWKTGFFQRHWPALLILAALSAIPYLPSLQYGYVLDDQIVIVGNKFTQKGLSGIGDILTTESMTGYFGEQKDLVAGARYRPLSIVTFAVEQALMPGKPFIGHLGNILFYTFTCLLLYRILLLLFPLPESRRWWWSIPFLTAVFYALHPLHTEVVANIKGRDEIMTFLGALGAIWLTLRWLADRKPVWLLLSGVSFFLGLLSKENAITFLAVIPAILYFFTKARSRDYGPVMAPVLAATVLYLIIRYNVIGYFLSSGKEITDLMNNPFVEMDGGEKLATIFYTLGLYLKLMVFPHPLTHDYYPYAIPIMSWTDWKVWVSLLAYVGLGVVFLRGYRQKTVPAFAVLFYLATLSIVSNLFFPVGTFMNERFIFISSLAWVLVLAWLLVEKLPVWLPRTAGLTTGMVLAAAVVAGYGFRTWTRVPVWEDALTLNRAAIKVSPNSARANTFMTTALFQKYKEETDPQVQQEMLNEMGGYIRRAIDIYPAYYSGLQMYVGVIAEEYRYDKDLDKLLAGFRRVFEYRENMPFIDEYLDYLDGQPALHPRLAEFYYDVGYRVFWQSRRKKAYAIKYLERGGKVMPSDPRFTQALQEVNRG